MFNREKLRCFLDEQRMTNTALANYLGVTEGMVRHILCGLKQPSLAMTVEIARLIGCTVDELVVKEEI